jgi:DNA-binding response OmpR family regulator
MTNAQPLILVVDDDPGLRELLTDYLSGSGLRVSTAPDGAAMRRLIESEEPDAVVLDLMLPGEDGLTLARWLRTRSALPILMLSARGEDVDRIVGLEVGADDYLAKPFNPRELLARLRALIRRAQGAVAAAAGPGEARGFGPFRLDLAAHRLTRDGIEVALTTAEFSLLRIFVEHPNRVLSRDMIMDLLKGYERSPFDRSIDVRVVRLRRKLEDDPGAPVYVRTVRGEGYLFSPKGRDA